MSELRTWAISAIFTDKDGFCRAGIVTITDAETEAEAIEIARKHHVHIASPAATVCYVPLRGTMHMHMHEPQPLK